MVVVIEILEIPHENIVLNHQTGQCVFVLLGILFFVYAVAQTELVGYLFHRLMHSPRAGRFYAAHMEHHMVQYPAKDCTSESYRKPAGISTTMLYVPVAIFVVIAHLAVLPLPLFAWFVSGLLLTAVANSYLHDSVHLRKIWLQRFRWFRRLQARHYIHHVQMATNYGVTQFKIDRTLGTYYKK